jgi:hypothetical protein
MTGKATRSPIAGIYDHAGWAIVVCVAGNKLLDKRRIELVDPGLPCLPHHHPCQHLPIDEAVALVARVRASAEACAARALDALPKGVGAIAIRKRPNLPPTVAERIRSYYAQTRADGVMYRDALEAAALARGWRVHEYEAKSVLAEAAAALRLKGDIDEWMLDVGRNAGRPWTGDHRLAMAAAIVAARSRPAAARRTARPRVGVAARARRARRTRR